MDWFLSLKIQTKIYLIVFTALIGFTIYFSVNLSLVNSQKQTIQDIKNQFFPLLQLSERSLVGLNQIKETMTSAVSAGELKMLARAKEQKEKLLEDLNLAAELDPNGVASEAIIAVNDYFDVSYEVSVGMTNGTIDFSKLEDQTNAIASSWERASELLKQLRETTQARFVSTITTAESRGERMVMLGILIAVPTLCFIFFISYFIGKNISSSLNEVVASLRDIAQENGDLTVRIETKSKDEIGQLVHWFNEFVAKLRVVIGGVVKSADPLSNLSSQLHELLNQVNGNLEHQKRSAETSKKAVELMQASINGIVIDTNQAVENANTANDESNQGQLVVGTTVEVIKSLSDAVLNASQVIRKLEADTDQVRNVIDVIKGIADQTNLLALNAAIEAARAGEQGRGFAVVADEVRSLASKTQESTEEINVTINNLISASQNAVKVMEEGTQQAESGVSNSEQAGESLTKISLVINTINEINHRISQAVNEQKTLSEDIVESVGVILQQAHQTASEAATLEKLASDLNSVSSNMTSLTKQFKI